MNEAQARQINVIPAEVLKVLELYQELVADSLPGFLQGFYLWGSIALREYIPNRSDIDFIAVSTRRANHRQVQQLGRVHRQICSSFPGTRLSGIYVCREDLGKTRKQISQYPYYHNRMHEKGYFELSEVTWWQLKKYSIRIFGESIDNFDFKIDERMLRKSVTLNIENYWKRWLTRHSRIWSARRWALACVPRLVEWGVLYTSRQFYTLNTGEVTSKSRAGLYCMGEFPKKHQPVLEYAVRVRNTDEVNLVSFNWKQSQSAISYISSVYSECERRNLFLY